MILRFCDVRFTIVCIHSPKINKHTLLLSKIINNEYGITLSILKHIAWDGLLFFFVRASGHVERFADLMVKDTVSGECFRLDHLIKAALEKQAAAKDAAPEFKEKVADIIIKVMKNGLMNSFNNFS